MFIPQDIFQKERKSFSSLFRLSSLLIKLLLSKSDDVTNNLALADRLFSYYFSFRGRRLSGAEYFLQSRRHKI